MERFGCDTELVSRLDIGDVQVANPLFDLFRSHVGYAAHCVSCLHRVLKRRGEVLNASKNSLKA